MMDSLPVIPAECTRVVVDDGSMAQAGDFADVFEDHFSDIYGYLVRRVGASAAEDLASQTFVVAFEHRANYVPHPSGVRPWLYGIATNLISTHRRHESRLQRATARLHLFHVESNGDDIERMVERAAARDEYQHLVGALDGLSDELRETLLLFAWADLTYEEIATALDIAPGTVGSRISRARQALTERLLEVEQTGRRSVGTTQMKGKTND
jgi:RNA polymerase sigma factor (sigma-70 family)